MDELVTCPNCGRRNRVPAAASGHPQCGNCHKPLPWIADAGEDNFAEIAEAASVPVVVDLWAPWCGPCRMVSPALEKVATEMAGKIKLVKVNVDEAPRLRKKASGLPGSRPFHRGPCAGSIRYSNVIGRDYTFR